MSDKDTYYCRKEYYKEYYKKNKIVIGLRSAKWYRDNKWKPYDQRASNHIPHWLTNEMKIEMRSYYLEAIHLSEVHDEKFSVDHIVPLKGKHVCGLHVPWNLEVLSQRNNSSKSNR